MSTCFLNPAEAAAELRRIDVEISAALTAWRAASDAAVRDQVAIADQCTQLAELHQARVHAWRRLVVLGADDDVALLLRLAARSAGDAALDEVRSWCLQADVARCLVEISAERAAAGVR